MSFSLFGGGGDAGQGAMNSAMGSLAGAGGYASGLGGLGQGALNGIYSPNLGPWLQNQQAVGQYYAGLGQNGLNANQQASYLGQFGDYTNPYTQAQSQSAAANAQRGFGALGGANSVSGSSSNYIAAQQAANLQSRLSQMGQYQTQMQPQWLQQAANAYFQPVQFGSGLGQAGLGQAANINLGQAQQYAGIGAEQFQQQMQQNQMLGQGLGSILGLGGQMYGMNQYLNTLRGLGGGAYGY